jgi:twitching motility two-component system response regulator PilH
MKSTVVRKILIVDDSPTERFFLADLLSKRGYAVVTAENGDEAATRAIARDPATQSIPVILCTSKGAESDRIWGLRQGAKEYVVKPVDPEELLAKIARLA